ncbi:hypothetical protein EXIGLDRAFT_768820 [Exidia glandulosa HHB12029]|uniref:Uncharacterized protein n=1 Tax=Exidia glandulosa HHB12029 TaxID=1314781 RepID=A0A165HXM1_EXIGL|nr:hypothetical protein EXIGLDRAFT_768820 [Exidia glandulosa HHB12029]
MAILLQCSEEFPYAIDIICDAVLPFVDLLVIGALREMGDEIAGLKAALSSRPPPAASAPPSAATSAPVASAAAPPRANACKDLYATRAASTTPRHPPPAQPSPWPHHLCATTQLDSSFMLLPQPRLVLQLQTLSVRAMLSMRLLLAFLLPGHLGCL